MNSLWKMVPVYVGAWLFLVCYVTVRFVIGRSHPRARRGLIWLTAFLGVVAGALCVYTIDEVTKQDPPSVDQSVRYLHDLYQAVTLYHQRYHKLPADLAGVAGLLKDPNAHPVDRYVYVPDSGEAGGVAGAYGRHQPVCWDREPHLVRHVLLWFREEPVWCVLFGDSRVEVVGRGRARLLGIVGPM